MRFIPLSLLLCGSCWAFSVSAADSAQDWLQRLGEAERSQSFQGTFVYERNGSFSTHSIWHRVEQDGAVRERLLQLDGPAQEVLRVNGRAECVSGALADQVAGNQAWPARELDVEQLQQWYELRLAGESRVADRAAVVLLLVPRDQHRYGVELHLDRDSGLPLKTLLLNDKGQLLERFQFTRLDTASPPADDSLQPSADCQSVRLAEAKAPAAGAWRADWLPPGFTLSSASQRRSPVSDEAVSCLVYDDGVARFSVFLEPLHGAAVGDARSQLGPTVAVSRRMATDDGDMMVTVVGEIPLGTAERVALSMRASEAQVAP
ncbi:MucB/RseB C-terminal domain-containing protein [Pseudomonas benzenivorans]|uniref:MucB/RseB C-terminal domain-containing protein n=1 Tax=Pseudomonas benzenivorans TaxID=556533 RepID=A0ABY5H491_9PSED|nr:MucB/RseB C-terminal domain-containing protein [Pseudomonas benzenivorans]UTW07045.1 MucB/RseB C-terminal domain-containing protein [Pseudomonas benzenivorans]